MFAEVINTAIGWITTNRGMVTVIVLVVLATLAGSRYLRLRRADPEKARKKAKQEKQSQYHRAKKIYEKAKADFEKKENAVVVEFIHDMGADFFGPRDKAYEYVDYEEAIAAVDKIQSNKDKNIAVVLHTLGGFSQPAHLVARALKNHNQHHMIRKDTGSIAYVPYFAMSAGTTMALATTKVCMGKNAELGPIDPSMSSFSNETFEHLINIRKQEGTQVSETVIMLAHETKKYDTYAKEFSEVHTNINHLGGRDGDGKPKNDLLDILSSGKLSHGQGISKGDAAKWGMHVETGIPPEIRQLINARLIMIKTSDEDETILEGLSLNQPSDGGGGGEDGLPTGARRMWRPRFQATS